MLYWNEPDVRKFFKEKEPNRYLLSLIEHYSIDNQERRSVLDIGCGYGRNLKPFAGRKWFLYGYDANQEAVAHTKKLYPSSSNIIVSNVEDQPYVDQKFDFVIADGVLHQLISKEAILSALKYIKIVAVEGGTVLLSIFTNDREPENCTSLAGNIYKNREGLPMLLLPSLEIIALIEDVGLSLKVCCSDIFNLTNVGKRANLTVVARR